MSCLFSQQPKTLPSLCWFIVALKGPALADVRQMALDMLSIQRPQTAHLQKRKVTVAQKLSKLQWYEEKSVRDWKERTAHGYRMLQLQEMQQGKKLVMKQMNQRKRQRCPSRHQQLPHITMFYCSRDPNRLHKPCLSPSFFSLFCLLLGKKSHESLLAVH